MKDMFRHYLNPLHVFCRLRQCRVPAPMARRMCRAYERVYKMVF